MDRYILFVNSSTDYLMFPLKAFIGAKYASATTIDLYFEKAPVSYKVTLTIDTGTGASISKKLAELFSRYTGSVIIVNDVTGVYPLPEITAVSGFTKIFVQ